MPSIIRLSGLRRGPRVLILVVTLLSTASVPCAAQAPPGFEPLVESPDGRVVLHYALGDFGLDRDDVERAFAGYRSRYRL